MEKGRVHSILKKIRQTNPVIYHFSSIQGVCLTANGLLAVGATPIITGVLEEADDMVKAADAVILHMNLSEREVVEKMILAGKSANKRRIPVILDTVGVRLSSYRKQLAGQLLKEINVSVICGNASEISHIIGVNWETFKEEKVGFNSDESELALLAAKKLHTMIVLTAKEKIVSDGVSTLSVYNGDPIVMKIAGSSHFISSIIGTFVAVEENQFEAAVSALIVSGVAAEIAANKTEGQGPGSFQMEFINQLASVSPSEIDLYGSFGVK